MFWGESVEEFRKKSLLKNRREHAWKGEIPGKNIFRIPGENFGRISRKIFNKILREKCWKNSGIIIKENSRGNTWKNTPTEILKKLERNSCKNLERNFYKNFEKNIKDQILGEIPEAFRKNFIGKLHCKVMFIYFWKKKSCEWQNFGKNAEWIPE